MLRSGLIIIADDVALESMPGREPLRLMSYGLASSVALRCVALQGANTRTAKGEGRLVDITAKVVAGGDAVGGVVQGQRVVLPIVVLQQLTVGLTSQRKVSYA